MIKLKSGKITVICGVRNSGKTTLLRNISKKQFKLEKNKYILIGKSINTCFRLNKDHWLSIKCFLNEILKIKPKYLILDEMDYKIYPNAKKFMKLLKKITKEINIKTVVVFHDKYCILNCDIGIFLPGKDITKKEKYKYKKHKNYKIHENYKYKNWTKIINNKNK
tara:strand:- start:334 stop:828 length:495 start_codon:yes stop_codon:yes gene_type:complete